MSNAPKSAYELAMEKLRKRDADAGIEEKPLPDEQRQAIAEARSLHDARVAERRILHQSAITATLDPVEIEAREAEFRRDLERLAYDRDARIKQVRGS